MNCNLHSTTCIGKQPATKGKGKQPATKGKGKQPATKVKGKQPATKWSLQGQYKRDGYLSGEKCFHKTAFNINKNDIKLIKRSLYSEDIQPYSGDIQSQSEYIQPDSEFIRRLFPKKRKLVVDAHENEIMKHTDFTYANGNCKFRLDEKFDKIQVLYKKIAENIHQHTGDRYLEIEVLVYKNLSEEQCRLGWHADWWLKKSNEVKNPKHIGVCVLEGSGDTDICEITKLKLGFIHMDNKLQYAADLIDKECDTVDFAEYSECTKLYYRNKHKKHLKCNETTIQNFDEFFLLNKEGVESAVTLNNTAGSGYLINQEHITDRYKLMVHCREYRPYRDDRLSLVIRCMCYDSEDELPFYE